MTKRGRTSRKGIMAPRDTLHRSVSQIHTPQKAKVLHLRTQIKVQTPPKSDSKSTEAVLRQRRVVYAVRAVTQGHVQRHSVFDEIQQAIESTRRVADECVASLQFLPDKFSQAPSQLTACMTNHHFDPLLFVVRMKALFRRRRHSSSKPSSLIPGRSRLFLKPPSLRLFEHRGQDNTDNTISSPTRLAHAVSFHADLSPKLCSPAIRYLPGVGRRCVRINKIRTEALVRELSSGGDCVGRPRGNHNKYRVDGGVASCSRSSMYLAGDRISERQKWDRALHVPLPPQDAFFWSSPEHDFTAKASLYSHLAPRQPI